MNLTPDQQSGDVAEAIIDYCSSFLFPLIWKTQGSSITVRCIDSNEFNASVRTTDHKNFVIILNKGVVHTLSQVIDSIQSDTIEDVAVGLSERLFDDSTKTNLIYDSLLFGSVFFVLLHELTHITAGHFNYFKDQQPASTIAEYAYSEIIDVDGAGKNDQLTQNIKLIELEADSGATDILMALSWELLTANDDCLRLTKADRIADEIPDNLRRAAREVMFYSSSLALAMIDATRGYSDVYPYSYTRIFNLCDVFVQHTLPSNVNFKETEHGLQFSEDADVREGIAEHVVPVFFNALELANVGSQNLGHDLRGTLGGADDSRPIESIFTNDLIQLMTSAVPDALETPEAVEQCALRQLKNEFNMRMVDYRVSG